jgi:hypothetical protein
MIVPAAGRAASPPMLPREFAGLAEEVAAVCQR